MFEEIESGEVRRLTAPILTASGERRIAESVFRRHRGRIYHYIVRVFADRRREGPEEKDTAGADQ